MFESLAGCELKRTPEQKIAKNTYGLYIHPYIMRLCWVCICWLFLVHHHHLSCLMTCYENDFGVKSVEIGFFAPSFLLNGFLPSGVRKSHVLFQWPPSQQVNWSSFLSSLLPLKVHRIIKSRFGSTYLLLSFQNTVSWGPWTAQLWAPVGSHKQQYCKILPLKVHQS